MQETHLTRQEHCTHCDLPLPRYPIQDPAITPALFCCQGCATVYGILHELNLQKYYSIRASSREKGRPAQVANTPYDYLNHPLFLEKAVEPLPSAPADSLHYRVTFLLEGVHCSACVWVIEKLSDFLPGVLQSRLDFGRSEAVVDFDSKKIRLGEIAARLNSLGYPPRIALDLTHEQRKTQEEKESRQQLIRIGVAGFCAGNLMMIAVSVYQGMFTGLAQKYLHFFNAVSVFLVLPAVFYSARPFYQKAWQGLKNRIVHMDLPISIAILGAFAVSLIHVFQGSDSVYFDSLAALIFLLLVGRWIQWAALRSVHRSIEHSRALLPEFAVLTSGTAVPLQALTPGDLIQISPGARIPVDGTVAEGNSSVDRAILTGESKLFTVTPGDPVLAGSLNLLSPLVIRTQATGKQTRMAQIQALVHQATLGPSPFLLWVDRVSRIFLIVILALSALTFIFWTAHSGVATALDRVLALLVVSCPCALGLATPLAMSLAVGTGAKHGILLKGVEVLEKLLQVRTIFFDKTGTLTRGQLVVHRVEGFLDPTTRASYWSKILAIENTIDHPIARSLCQSLTAQGIEAGAWNGPIQAIPGRGIHAREGQEQWHLGSVRWLVEEGVTHVPESPAENTRTQVAVAHQKKWLGTFFLQDEIRPEAKGVIQELQRRGMNVQILSGDAPQPVLQTARSLGIAATDAHSNLDPQGKLAILKFEKNDQNHPTAFVGDGVNDAAALAASDVGFGMADSARLTLDAAPVCLARADLGLVIRTLDLAKNTRRIILRNFAFSLTYNLLGSALAIAGVINPLWAAVLMPMSSLTVVGSTLLSQPLRGRPWT